MGGGGELSIAKLIEQMQRMSDEASGGGNIGKRSF
jgi:hypothetical protein